MNDTDDFDFEPYFQRIKKRYAEIKKTDPKKGSFIAHLESLGYWETDSPPGYVYPDIKTTFPKHIYIAYAICDQGCGTLEFIVEGSTQECQYCGRHMYRMDTKTYELKAPNRRKSKSKSKPKSKPKSKSKSK